MSDEALPLPPAWQPPPELAWLPRDDAAALFFGSPNGWAAGRSVPAGAYLSAYWPWIAGGALMIGAVMLLRRR